MNLNDYPLTSLNTVSSVNAGILITIFGKRAGLRPPRRHPAIAVDIGLSRCISSRGQHGASRKAVSGRVESMSAN